MFEFNKSKKSDLLFRYKIQAESISIVSVNMNQPQEQVKHYIVVIITEATQVRTAASTFTLVTAMSIQLVGAVILTASVAGNIIMS